MTAGFYASPNALIEFMYARQSSELVARGAGERDVTVSKMNIDNYHVNFVYNWGEADAKLRPYCVCRPRRDQLLARHVPFPSALRGELDGNAQFSTTWGAGVKYYLAPSVGLKAGMRWTPTYIKSDPARLLVRSVLRMLGPVGPGLLASVRIHRAALRSGSNRPSRGTCSAGVRDSSCMSAFFCDWNRHWAELGLAAGTTSSAARRRASRGRCDGWHHWRLMPEREGASRMEWTRASQ